MTIGAVSQHLRRAEERLGIELFERTPAGLKPLPALKAALPQLTAGFTGLADGLGAFPVTLMVLHLRRQDVIYAAGLDVVCGIRGPSRGASTRQPAQNLR